MPDWIKKKKAIKQAKDGLLNMVAYLRDQERAISENLSQSVNSDYQSIHNKFGSQDSDT